MADYANPGGRIRLVALHNCAVDGSEWLLPNDVVYGSRDRVPRDLLGFIPAAVVAALPTVGTAFGAEEANVIAGGTAENLKVEGGAALHADGLSVADAFSWQGHRNHLLGLW